MNLLPRYILGLRTAAIFETLIFLAGVCLLDYYLAAGDRYIQLYPHPFSIIIILVAVQYGTAEAIMSTILSTICLYAWNLPPQQIHETLFDYQFRLAITPLLWFLVSFVVGELRMRLEYQMDAVENELREVKKHANTISREYESLKETKENFEAYLVSQYNTITNTYQSLKALEVLNPSKILMNLEEVVQGALNTEKFSVYAMGEDGLEVVTSHGWDKKDRFALRIKKDNPIFSEIHGERRILCVVNEDDEKILQKEGLLAGPIIDRKTKKLLGMLKIEKMKYMDLNISSIETFKSLCELIGIAYANARDYVKVKSNSIYQLTEPLLFSHLLYQIERKSTKNLCQKLQQPLSCIAVTCNERMDEPEEEKMLAELSKTVAPLIPTTSTLFSGARKEKTLLVLLPTISLENCENICQKISATISENSLLNNKGFTYKNELIFNPQANGEASNHD